VASALFLSSQDEAERDFAYTARRAERAAATGALPPGLAVAALDDYAHPRRKERHCRRSLSLPVSGPRRRPESGRAGRLQPTKAVELSREFWVLPAFAGIDCPLHEQGDHYAQRDLQKAGQGSPTWAHFKMHKHDDRKGDRPKSSGVAQPDKIAKNDEEGRGKCVEKHVAMPKDGYGPPEQRTDGGADQTVPAGAQRSAHIRLQHNDAGDGRPPSLPTAQTTCDLITDCGSHGDLDGVLPAETLHLTRPPSSMSALILLAFCHGCHSCTRLREIACRLFLHKEPA
jgi:hypothetical protein